MFSSISGLSQDIHTSANLVMEQIAEIEFRDAYQNKRKSVYKWRSGDWIVKHSDIARKINAYDEFLGINKTNTRLIKLKSKSYILQETEPVLSQAYYMKGEALDTIAMFGIGDVDNDQIYYASPDYDCDQHLWCRWYSFTEGKAAMIITGPWKIADFTTSGIDFGITTLPEFPGQGKPASSFSGIRLAFVSEFSENPEEAAKFKPEGLFWTNYDGIPRNYVLR